MDADVEAISPRLIPLFEGHWSYAEFTKLMPFGPGSEGQAFAVSTESRIAGERLSGSYRMVQYPRWRADGLYLPDAHGLVETESHQQVIIKAGGFVIPVAGEDDGWTIAHWMRFWSSASELAWLNGTVAIGVGSMIDGDAHVRYFAAAPTAERSYLREGAPRLSLLGTADWNYPEYEAIRVFGDNEGIGFAASIGIVEEGPLEGAWRGWHYPTYLRNGLYQLDAHVAIDGVRGLVLSRHGGLATRPPDPSGDVMYEVVQHATFVTEAPDLADLNRTLALGVGYVRHPGLVHVSYYAVNG